MKIQYAVYVASLLRDNVVLYCVCPTKALSLVIKQALELLYEENVVASVLIKEQRL